MTTNQTKVLTDGIERGNIEMNSFFKTMTDAKLSPSSRFFRSLDFGGYTKAQIHFIIIILCFNFFKIQI